MPRMKKLLICLCVSQGLYGCLPSKSNSDKRETAKAPNQKQPGYPNVEPFPTNPNSSAGSGSGSTGSETPNPNAQTVNPQSTANANQQTAAYKPISGPLKPTGNPREVIYRDDGYGDYLSQVQNEVKGKVDFSCPGDSVLVGEVSEFDSKSGDNDRKYQFLCKFMTDGQGVPLRKNNCAVSKTQTGTKISYACPAGKYLAGQKSIYSGQTMDRSYQYECCEMRSQKGSKVSVAKLAGAQGAPGTAASCSSEREGLPSNPILSQRGLANLQVNARRAPLEYNCENAAVLPVGGLKIDFNTLQAIPHAVLTEVQSEFDSGANDRRHSFFCCQLQVESE